MRPARDADEVAAAQRLRIRVFCEEQGVSREEEVDGRDDESLHVIAADESGVIATCRLRFTAEGCKLERMAVEARLRGLGAGARLLEGAEQAGRERGSETMVLHAQRSAESFYAAHGYLTEGEPFMEAEIEHVRMRKAL
ncbi:MAG: GNAT family N-acetyltransferase [Solirubrobacterales bacterium]